MSLCTREQHALTAIEATLRRSDPSLAAHMAGFNQFNAGEDMPRRERLPERQSRLAGVFLLLAVTAAGLLAVLIGVLTGPGGQCVTRPAAAGIWHGPSVSGSACPARHPVVRQAPFTNGQSASGGSRGAG